MLENADRSFLSCLVCRANFIQGFDELIYQEVLVCYDI